MAEAADLTQEAALLQVGVGRPERLLRGAPPAALPLGPAS